VTFLKKLFFTVRSC